MKREADSYVMLPTIDLLKGQIISVQTPYHTVWVFSPEKIMSKAL